MRAVIFSQSGGSQAGRIAAACTAAGFETLLLPSCIGPNGTTLNVPGLLPLLDAVADNELVLALDGDQPTACPSPDRIAETFAARNCDLIIAAQFRFDFPDERLRRFYWKFFPRSGGPLAYASAQGMIGKAFAFRAVIGEALPSYGTASPSTSKPSSAAPDQVIVNRYYADRIFGVCKQPIRVMLDQDQTFFKVCEPLKDGSAWRRHYALYRFERDRLQQKRTHTTGTANATLGSGLHALARVAAISLINGGEVRPSRIFRYRPNQNPEWQNAMQGFLAKLEAWTPFAFTHFNDGELTFIEKYLGGDHRETWFGRKQNKYTRKLGEHLVEAVRHKAQDYFVGVPCKTCFPRLRALADRIRPHDAMTLPAMSLHHNLSHIPKLLSLLQGRRCYFIKNARQDLSVFASLGLTVDEADITIVPFRAAHDLHNEMLGKRFADGGIVLLTCGMLAKTVTRHWFANNPNTTFLAFGSALDDLTQVRDGNYRPYPRDLPWTGDIFRRKSFMFGRKKDPCKECFDFGPDEAA